MPKLAGAIRRSWHTAQRRWRLVYRNQCPNLHFLPWNLTSPGLTIQVSTGGEDLLGDPTKCVRKTAPVQLLCFSQAKSLAFAVLRAEPRALHMLGKPSTTELQTQPNSDHLWFSVSISSTPAYMFRTYLMEKSITSMCGLPGLSLKNTRLGGSNNSISFSHSSG